MELAGTRILDRYEIEDKISEGSISHVYRARDVVSDAAVAVKILKKGIQRMPGFAVGYNNLGIAYGKLGKSGEEITALKKAIKLRPSYSGARYNLGMTYLKVKDKKAAMREYESLKEFDEGAAEALLKEINKAS